MRAMGVLLALAAVLLAAQEASTIPVGPQGGIAAPAPPEWTDCGGGATTLTVKSVDVSPSIVPPGKNFTLTITCESADQITGGSFITQVYLLGVPVYKETDNLCNKHPCPISEGAMTLVTTTLMPSITPKGRYDIKVTGMGDDELPVICADIHFSVG
ncbi:ML domain-containing protein [Baffinella frigidus]|nr:ML domain-containing protein [Cryptophyta sp. CCMP2293]